MNSLELNILGSRSSWPADVFMPQYAVPNPSCLAIRTGLQRSNCIIIKQSTGLSANAQGTQVECETHADRTLDDVSLYPGWPAAEAACDLSISCEVFAIMPIRFLLHSPTHVH